MPRPLVYLDECVRASLAVRLRLRGFAIETAQAHGMVGITDIEQLAYATSRGAMIVTYDRRHFRPLSFRVRSHGGIVTLPDSLPEWQEVRIAMLIDWAATFPDHRSQLFRWHDLQQRLIESMRLPGYDEGDGRLALGQTP